MVVIDAVVVVETVLVGGVEAKLVQKIVVR